MSALVLDCSVAMAWCFEDQTTAFTEAVLDAVVAGGALVPCLWPLEAANVLLVAERKRKVGEAQATQLLHRLLALPIQLETGGDRESWARVHALGRAHALSSYDAAYLDLAIRTGLPLATLDRDLKKAAERAGVPLVPPA